MRLTSRNRAPISAYNEKPPRKVALKWLVGARNAHVVKYNSFDGILSNFISDLLNFHPMQARTKPGIGIISRWPVHI